MEISDPKTIRALAHPLRLDLLQLLGSSGPATAAQCGRVLGASQASCSFHLRQLAKYGFVEDAGPGHDRRERQWRVAGTDTRLTVRIGTGENAVVRQQIEEIVVEREMQAILDYSRRPDGADPQWQHKAGIVTTMAVLSPDDAAAIKEKWIALLAPYIARAGDEVARTESAPGRRHVRYFMAATPLPEPDSIHSEDGSGD
ncbi:MAG TPA: helix-turn-helix domain-containing protein [Streptosporangiaceae bacterium]|nr:helix-turn-helix domain-containing protein [Streptosporangiaceae bacterium]